MKISMRGQENLIFSYRWLLNRGDYMDSLARNIIPSDIACDAITYSYFYRRLLQAELKQARS